jgi:phospholipid-binding lipoprotein MlaA
MCFGGKAPAGAPIWVCWGLVNHVWRSSGSRGDEYSKGPAVRALLSITTSSLLAGLLSACAVSPDPNSLAFDPFEDGNRPVHDANKSVDRAVYRPVSQAYGKGLPATVRQGVTNLNRNWESPGHVVQYALQGRPEFAGAAFMRFGVNTLFGFGGLIDIAGELGIDYRDTNVDETLYRWGVPEGGYVVLPFGGPGTQRDWTGWALDFVLDPVQLVAGPAAGYALVGASTLDLANDRYEFDGTLDELLYRSEDSYTAVRLSYLQNMRGRLRGGTGIDLLEDVYEDY